MVQTQLESVPDIYRVVQAVMHKLIQGVLKTWSQGTLPTTLSVRCGHGRCSAVHTQVLVVVTECTQISTSSARHWCGAVTSRTGLAGK